MERKRGLKDLKRDEINIDGFGESPMGGGRS